QPVRALRKPDSRGERERQDQERADAEAERRERHRVGRADRVAREGRGRAAERARDDRGRDAVHRIIWVWMVSESSLPPSSVTRVCQTCVRLPLWSGVASARSFPAMAAAKTLV